MKILFLALYIFFICNNLESKIVQYNVINYYIKDKNNTLYLATRHFKTDKNYDYLFVIDCKTFNTKVLLNDNLKKVSDLSNIIQFTSVFNQEPLKNALKIQKLLNLDQQVSNNIFLTVDLCPSSKFGFDNILFEELILYSKKNAKNINVAISITAEWIKKHKKEFNLLKKWHNEGLLNITWVNHSYTHFYNSKLKNESNFMLYDKKNFYNEVINNEIFMLELGIIPSIFFRFPGLVYDKDLLNKIRQLSLIVLDADAWLVKTNGKFSSGSIILIHGNKNEPLGINIFYSLLKKGKFNKYNFASINEIYKR